MTREEFISTIRHLKWERRSDTCWRLRSSTGDCPILAAFHVLFPHRTLFLQNWDCVWAAEELGLSVEEARLIVREADTPTWKSVDFPKLQIDQELT